MAGMTGITGMENRAESISDVKSRILQEKMNRYRTKSGDSKFSEELSRYFEQLPEQSPDKTKTKGLEDGQVSNDRIRREPDIQAEIQRDPERKRLYEVAQEFQSIFINLMLKSMRKTLNQENDLLYGGNRQKIFEDFLYDEYAKSMSKSPGFNLSDQVYEELTRSMPPVDMDAPIQQENPYSHHGKKSITTDQLIDDRFLNSGK